MNALWLHLRTSPMRWAPLPMTALAVLLLALRPSYWVGNWPETGAAAQVPAFYLSALAAGASAWMSGATARHGLLEQTAAAPIPAAKVEIHRLGAAAILLFVPYVLGQAVAFVATVRTFPAGFHLWVGYFLMGAFTVLLAVVWGWTAGRFFPSGYAALVAMLSWFLVEAYSGTSTGMSVLDGPAWKEPSIGGTLVRLAVLGVFVAAVVCSPRGPDLRRTSWKAFAQAAAGLALTIAAIVATTGVADRPPPRDPLCVAGQIEMCLWPENSAYVPLVHSVDARVTALRGQWRIPARLYEYGLKQRSVDYDGRSLTQLEGDFQISEGNRWSLALGVSEVIVRETLDSCDWNAITAARDFTAEALRRWVELHLANGSTPEYRTSEVSQEMRLAWSSASTAFRELTPRQQSAWVQERLDHLEAEYCD